LAISQEFKETKKKYQQTFPKNVQLEMITFPAEPM
jgi:hypothetical protein